MAGLNIQLSEFLLIPAIVLAALHSLYFALFQRGHIASQLSILFLLLVGFFVLNLDSIFHYPSAVYFSLMRMAILIPAMLWLLTFNLFSDEGQVTWKFWLLVGCYFTLQSIGTGLSLWSDNDPESHTLMNISFVIVPQLVMIGLALHSLYLALNGYYSDLIQTRRIVRVVFVACIAVLILLVLGNSILESIDNLTQERSRFPEELFPESLIAAYILALMCGFHLFTFTLRGDIDLLVRLPEPTDAEDLQQEGASQHKETEHSAERELAAQIVAVMESEKLYREEKYTITQFANHLAIPEHRLRQIINKQMKHRNFNQFLNGFRIAEATANLENTDLPISSIAYEVGFSTLSVFNRAFKEKTGTTPKEYRNSH